MNDGNTALPVSPVTKEEAMSLSSTFSKLAEMLVQASSLPDHLARVQAELDTIRVDHEAQVTHARELDNSLREMREQRDKAENSLAESNRQLGDAQRKITELDGVNEKLTGIVQSLRTDLATARKDLDDALMHSLELEEQVKTWKGRADQGRAQLAKLQDLFKPDPEPVPEPKPEPVAVQAPEPTPPTPAFQGLPPSAAPVDPPKYEDQTDPWNPNRF